MVHHEAPTRSSPRIAIPTTEAIPILLEEYRQLYELSRLRLGALDRRTPIAAVTFAIGLGGMTVASEPLQLILLVAIPLSLLWWLSSTITHARSFEDALRRIEQIEGEINRESGRQLLVFQSSHPSRGQVVGGRTGEETIQSVLAGSAVILGACLYLFLILFSPYPPLWQICYTVYVAGLCVSMHLLHARLRLYRYQPKGTEVAATPHPTT